MVIYEVNLHVNPAVAEAFASWLRAHIRAMLTHDGFTHATWYRAEGDDDRLHWTIHYFVADSARLDAYFAGPADAMRADGRQRFGDAFTADRRILHEEASFP